MELPEQVESVEPAEPLRFYKKGNKSKAKNTLTLFEIAFFGVEKITLNEKWILLKSTLTSNHRKPKLTQ